MGALESAEVLVPGERTTYLAAEAIAMYLSPWWHEVPVDNGKRGRIVLEQDPLIVIETNGPLCREIPWR